MRCFVDTHPVAKSLSKLQVSGKRFSIPACHAYRLSNLSVVCPHALNGTSSKLSTSNLLWYIHGTSYEAVDLGTRREETRNCMIFSVLLYAVDVGDAAEAGSASSRGGGDWTPVQRWLWTSASESAYSLITSLRVAYQGSRLRVSRSSEAQPPFLWIWPPAPQTHRRSVAGNKYVFKKMLDLV